MKYWNILNKYTHALKGLYLTAVFLEILSALASIGVIFLNKVVIDDIFTLGKYDMFVPVILLFTAATTVYFIAHALAFILARKTEMNIRYNLSNQLLDYFHLIPIATLRKEKVSRLSTFFWSEIDSTADYVCFRLMQGIVDIARFVVISGIILYFDWRVYAIIMMCGVYLIWHSKRYGPKLKQVSKQVYELNAEMTVVIEEGIASSREVIANQRQKWEEERIASVFRNYYQRLITELKLMNKNFLTSEPTRWGAQIATLGFAGYQVINGTITIGMLVVLYSIGSQLIGVVHNLHKFATQSYSQMGAIERLEGLINGPKIQDGKVSLEEPIHTIAFEHLYFGYSDSTEPVLKNLNVKIVKGETIAFVGPSGAGKSTILQMLTRTYDPKQGEIIVNQLPITHYRRNSVMQRIGIVGQEPFFFPDTIWNNLTMGDTSITEQTVQRACRVACIDMYIDNLPDKYFSLLGERGVNLSGGQLQRLAIARTLLLNPEILVLDEATSALDQETEKVLQDRIRQYYPQLTQIIIAHRLSTVREVDRVIVLDKGSIVGEGTFDELYQNNELFKQLVEAENRDNMSA